jgi:hypothetical protein
MRLVLEFEASGLRQNEFCRNYSLALSTLQRQLKRRNWLERGTDSLLNVATLYGLRVLPRRDKWSMHERLNGTTRSANYPFSPRECDGSQLPNALGVVGQRGVSNSEQATKSPS